MNEKIDTRYIRLTNGENVVAKVEEILEGYPVRLIGYKLIFPLSIYIEFAETTNNKILVMLPWIPRSVSDSKEVILSTDRILYTVPLNDDVSTYILTYSEGLYDKEKYKHKEDSTPLGSSTLDEIAGSILGKSSGESNESIDQSIDDIIKNLQKNSKKKLQ